MRAVPPQDPTFEAPLAGTIRCPIVKPNGLLVRLMRVIADPTLHPRRLVAFELALRVVAIALVTLLILGILPAIAGAAA
jgi:hypothetical protein